MSVLDDLSDRIRQAVHRGRYRVQPCDKWTAETGHRYTGREPTHPDGRLVVIVKWKNRWRDDARTTIPPTYCSWLVPEDIAPLLSHSHAEVREAAMRLLGRLD